MRSGMRKGAEISSAPSTKLLQQLQEAVDSSEIECTARKACSRHLARTYLARNQGNENARRLAAPLPQLRLHRSGLEVAL